MDYLIKSLHTKFQGTHVDNYVGTGVTSVSSDDEDQADHSGKLFFF